MQSDVRDDSEISNYLQPYKHLLLTSSDNPPFSTTNQWLAKTGGKDELRGRNARKDAQ
jgi:hypothetical protein